MADFKSRYLSSIEEGKGLIGGAKEAASGTMGDLKKQFSAKGMKEQLIRNTFGGDDILSAMIRGKMGVKKKDEKDKTPSKEGGLGEEGVSSLATIAKNSMVLPGMFSDMKAMQKNISELVRVKGGKSASGATEFFRKQRKKEDSLEGVRKSKTVSKIIPKAAGKKKPAGIMDILGDIVGFIGGALIEVIKSLFNPTVIIGLLKKLALPLLIISTLFSGIMAGFNKYQETGSFSEAIVSGLGGMLSFLTFGLLGEDTLKQVFDSLSGVFKPVLDTVSNIFDSIKGFFKNIFGDSVDIKEVESASPKDVVPKMGAGDAGGELGGMMKELGMPELPKGLAGDLGGVMDSMAKGDLKGVASQAEAMKEKYPSQGGGKEETPDEQAKRNYELNKNLTSKVSGALGINLPEPAPPNAAPASAAPATGGGGASPLPVAKDKDAPDLAPAGSEGDASPSPAPAALSSSPTATGSGDKFADKAESNKLGALQFLKRTLGILPDKDGVYLDMRNGEKKLSEEEVRSRISAAGKDPDKVLGLLKGADGGGTIDLKSGNLNQITGGAIGGGAGSSPSASTPAPEALTEKPPTSGASLSTASTEVAEAQRMESAADQGSTVNAPTNNNNSGSSGKPNKQTSSAYDTDFATRLATT